jgi:hypothetical protein
LKIDHGVIREAREMYVRPRWGSHRKGGEIQRKSGESRRTEEDEDSIEREFRNLFIHDTSGYGVRPF